MIYKITFKKNLKILTSVLLLYNLAFILVFGYAFIYMDNSYGVVTAVAMIYYAMAILPTLLLHLEYYLINSNDIVDIDLPGYSITINDSVKSFDDVKLLTFFMAHSWHRNSSFRLWPFEAYRYAKLTMNDGSKYIFTCLMGTDLNELLVIGAPLEKKVTFIASPTLAKAFDKMWN